MQVDGTNVGPVSSFLIPFKGIFIDDFTILDISRVWKTSSIFVFDTIQVYRYTVQESWYVVKIVLVSIWFGMVLT